VHVHVQRAAFGPIIRAAVLEVADQLLLLGVDRDRRLTRRKRFLHPTVEVVELRVAIGIVRSLPCLRAGLKKKLSDFSRL